MLITLRKDREGRALRFARTIEGVDVLCTWDGAVGIEVTTGEVLWDFSLSDEEVRAIHNIVEEVAGELGIGLVSNDDTMSDVATLEELMRLNRGMEEALRDRGLEGRYRAHVDIPILRLTWRVAGVDKSKGIEFFMDYLKRKYPAVNIDEKDILSIGDGSQDLPMLRKTSGVYVGREEKLGMARGLQGDMIDLGGGPIGAAMAMEEANFYIPPEFQKAGRLKRIAKDYHFFGNLQLTEAWIRERSVLTGRSFDEVTDGLIRNVEDHGAVTRYSILPEEDWIYILPMMAYATEHGYTPFFIERGGEIFLNAWLDLADFLRERGIEMPTEHYSHKISGQPFRQIVPHLDERLKYGREFSLAAQINSLLSEQELVREVTEAEWVELRRIYEEVLTEVDREKVDAYLGIRGINGGFQALVTQELEKRRSGQKGLSLGAIVTLIADAGIDERYLKAHPRRDVLRVRLKEFEQRLEAAGRDSFHMDELVTFFGDILTLNEVDEFQTRLSELSDGKDVINLSLLVARSSPIKFFIYSLARRDFRGIKATMTHSVRPLLNSLLRETHFSQWLKNRKILFIDDIIGPGRALSIVELVARAYQPETPFAYGIITLLSEEMIFEGFVDTYSLAGEIRPPEDEVSIARAFYKPCFGSVERAERINYDEMRSELLRRIRKKGLNPREVDEVREEYREELNRLIAENPDIFDGLSGLSYAERRPPLNVEHELIKLFIRGNDSLISSAIVWEYLSPFWEDSLNLNLYQSNARAALARLEQKDNELFAKLRELDLLIREYEELEVLEKWDRERYVYRQRQRATLKVLDDEGLWVLVKQYLAEPDRTLFEKIREQATRRIMPQGEETHVICSIRDRGHARVDVDINLTQEQVREISGQFVQTLNEEAMLKQVKTQGGNIYVVSMDEQNLDIPAAMSESLRLPLRTMSLGNQAFSPEGHVIEFAAVGQLDKRYYCEGVKEGDAIILVGNRPSRDMIEAIRAFQNANVQIIAVGSLMENTASGLQAYLEAEDIPFVSAGHFDIVFQGFPLKEEIPSELLRAQHSTPERRLQILEGLKGRLSRGKLPPSHIDTMVTFMEDWPTPSLAVLYAWLMGYDFIAFRD